MAEFLPLGFAENTQFFWLFGGENYYARGGMHDFLGAYSSYDMAISAGEALQNDPHSHLGKDVDWYHVVDIRTVTIVARSSVQAYGVDDD